MAITKEQIWAAADDLVAASRNPTLAAVRERLGGGSYTDISAAMQIWRANRQTRASPAREPAPPAIVERLTSFGADIWALALELADGRLQAEREALTQARADAERTRREAAELADHLAAELDHSRAQLTAQTAQLASLDTEVRQLRQDLASTADTLAATRHRAETAEAAHIEAQRRADQWGALLEREREAHLKAEAEIRQQAERAAAALAERDTSRAELERLREDYRAQHAELVETTRRADLAAAARSELQTALDREREARATVEAEAKTLGSQNAELRAALAAEQRRAVAAEQSVAALGRELDAARIAEHTARARLDSAERDMAQLRQERTAAEDRARLAVEAAAELRGRSAAGGL